MLCVGVSIYALLLSIANPGFSNDIGVLKSETRHGQLQCADPKFVVDKCRGHTLTSDRLVANILGCKRFKCTRKCRRCLPKKKRKCQECCGKCTDGGWSEWGECTRSCEGGIKKRTCTSPVPEKGGAECFGNDIAQCNKNIRCDSNYGKDGFVNQRAICFFLKCEKVPVHYQSCCDVWKPVGKCASKCEDGKNKHQCRVGWAFLENSECYLLIPAPDFKQAEHFCKLEGGYVAEINSQDEQQALTKFYKFDENNFYNFDENTHVWLGAKYYEREGKWRWIYSDTVVDFTSLGSSQPDNPENGDCILWDGEKLWRSISCNHRDQGYKAICEAGPLKLDCSNLNPSGTEEPNRNSPRIVCGDVAQKNEFPWQVGLVKLDKPFCGGSLIGTGTVITAAHCLKGEKISSFFVLVGEHDFTNNDGQKKMKVKQIINHPLYNSKTYDYDFSIIILENSIKWSEKVRTICLPTPSLNYEGIKAIVSGWGTENDGKNSDVLQKADVVTMSNDACTKNTEYSTSRITENMICATNNGIDACYGDSGGPLSTLETRGYYSIIGVVSWGERCGDPKYPSVYSRVSPSIIDDWIKPHIKGETCEELADALFNGHKLPHIFEKSTTVRVTGRPLPYSVYYIAIGGGGGGDHHQNGGNSGFLAMGKLSITGDFDIIIGKGGEKAEDGEDTIITGDFDIINGKGGEKAEDGKDTIIAKGGKRGAYLREFGSAHEYLDGTKSGGWSGGGGYGSTAGGTGGTKGSNGYSGQGPSIWYCLGDMGTGDQDSLPKNAPVFAGSGGRGSGKKGGGGGGILFHKSHGSWNRAIGEGYGGGGGGPQDQGGAGSDGVVILYIKESAE